MPELHEDKNPREIIGGNNPPTEIDDARSVYATIQSFMRDAPVIEDEKTARAANEKLAAGTSMLKTLERVRKDEADPLYAAWQAARKKYEPAISGLSKLVDELSARLAAFMRAEEARREAAAEETRKAAEEAERIAREAEKAEFEARENASMGELVDVGAAMSAADDAFSDFKEADRAATIAEKETPVRFRSRFASRATSLRTKETLVLLDALAAIGEIGVTEKIGEAILSEARVFRKANGRLPNGVTAQTERTL